MKPISSRRSLVDRAGCAGRPPGGRSARPRRSRASSRQPSMWSSVDLPEPDGPMMATISPALDVDRGAAQSVDVVVLAQLVALGEAAARSRWSSSSRPVLCLAWSSSRVAAVGLPCRCCSSRGVARALACRPSLVPEGEDRLEPRRVQGGVEAADHTEDDARRPPTPMASRGVTRNRTVPALRCRPRWRPRWTSQPSSRPVAPAEEADERRTRPGTAPRSAGGRRRWPCGCRSRGSARAPTWSWC